MRIILLALLLTFTLPAAASAQENFTALGMQENEQRIDQRLGLTVPHNEKKYENLPAPDQIRMKYYDYCMAQNHPMLFFWAKKRQCICTSNLINKVMSEEDIIAMGEDTDRGKAMRQTMLLKAYAPCMQEPVQRVTLALCKSNKEALYRIKDPETMCGCVADVVSRSVNNEAYAIVQRVFYSDPVNATPLTSYLSKKEFFTQSELAMRQCFTALETRTPPYPGITPAERMRRDTPNPKPPR